MRVLVVDDDPRRHAFFDQAYLGDEVVHAYGYYEATDALTKGSKFEVVQLDHDLGDLRKPDTITEMYGNLELTGYHVAHFMATELEFKLRPDRVIVHSVNPDGAASIERLLERHHFDVCRIPFLLSETSAKGV